jgi:hypothetical protein
MVNYNEGKIYKIVGNGMTYYGSSADKTLARRLSSHRSRLKRYKAGKCNYMTSFKIIETGNYDIVLVENVSCKSKDELHARERYYKENYECVNKNIPGRSKGESDRAYGKTHRAQIKKTKKIYYEANKERMKEYNKITTNCPCGGKNIHQHKLRHTKKKHQQYTMLLSFNQFSFSITNIINTIYNIPV